MRSAMAPSADGRQYSLTLSVPAELAPLTLACVLHVTPPPGANGGARPRFLTPLRGRHFSALIGCSPGSAAQPGPLLLPPQPAPHGAAAPAAGQARGRGGRGVVDTAPGAAAAGYRPVSFAVRCRGAERVCLVLLRPQEEGEWGWVELALDPVLNRSGELWHIAGGRGGRRRLVPRAGRMVACSRKTPRRSSAHRLAHAEAAAIPPPLCKRSPRQAGARAPLHPAVEGLHSLEGLCYGWRLEGDVSWESGSRIQPCELPACSWPRCDMHKGVHTSALPPMQHTPQLALPCQAAAESLPPPATGQPPLLPLTLTAAAPAARSLPPLQTSCCSTPAAPRCATSPPGPPPRAPPCRCQLSSCPTAARWPR